MTNIFSCSEWTLSLEPLQGGIFALAGMWITRTYLYAKGTSLFFSTKTSFLCYLFFSENVLCSLSFFLWPFLSSFSFSFAYTLWTSGVLHNFVDSIILVCLLFKVLMTLTIKLQSLSWFALPIPRSRSV